MVQNSWAILSIAINSDEAKHAKAFTVAHGVLIAKTTLTSFAFSDKGEIGFV